MGKKEKKIKTKLEKKKRGEGDDHVFWYNNTKPQSDSLPGSSKSDIVVR